jgi:hypothetical protein
MDEVGLQRMLAVLVVVLLLIPVMSYLCVKWSVVAFYRGKQFVKKYLSEGESNGKDETR